MNFADKSIKFYSDKLASKSPAPGGGSTAAVIGMLGCGLLSMVANFTLAGKGFNGYKERSQKALKKSENIRKKLLLLIDKDVKAYQNLSKASKKHKDNIVRLQPALKRAITPPADICNYTYKATVVALELAYVGSKNILSDVVVAVYALDAAFESALENININLKDVKDKKYSVRITEKNRVLHREIKQLKTNILSKARERMQV